MVFVVRYHVVTSLPESSEAEQQLLLQICQQLVFGMLQVGVAAGSGSHGENRWNMYDHVSRTMCFNGDLMI